MGRKGITLALMFSIVLLGCSSSKKVAVANPALDTMMAQKKIEFNATSLRPVVTNAMSQVAQSGLIPPGSNIGRIDLSGTSNFLKIDGDSVSANLAYYGERRLGGGYNSTTGIEFNGVPENLEIVKDDTQKSYSIKFSIREKMETLKVYIQMPPSLSGTIDITSSHRTRIAYTATAQALKEKK